jgi:hypothetical protein
MDCGWLCFTNEHDKVVAVMQCGCRTSVLLGTNALILLCVVQVDKQARAASQARVLQLLWQGNDGTAGCQPDTVQQPATLGHPSQPPTAVDWAPGGIWGLGTCKTLQWFEGSCGVNFKQKRIERRALFGGQDPDAFLEQ